MRGLIADSYETAVLRAYNHESRLPGAMSRVPTGPGKRETRPEFLLAYQKTTLRCNAVTGQWAAVIDDGSSVGELLDATWDAIIEIVNGIPTIKLAGVVVSLPRLK